MHDIDYVDIGKQIRLSRKDKGWTQEKLAEMSGVGSTHISHIETGKTIPSLKTFIAIINELQVSSDKILCGNTFDTKRVLNDEILILLDDCDNQERRFIIDVIKTVKLGLSQLKL